MAAGATVLALGDLYYAIWRQQIGERAVLHEGPLPMPERAHDVEPE